jgi:hypothetical protein
MSYKGCGKKRSLPTIQAFAIEGLNKPRKTSVSIVCHNYGSRKDNFKYNSLFMIRTFRCNQVLSFKQQWQCGINFQEETEPGRFYSVPKKPLRVPTQIHMHPAPPPSPRTVFNIYCLHHSNPLFGFLRITKQIGFLLLWITHYMLIFLDVVHRPSF